MLCVKADQQSIKDEASSSFLCNDMSIRSGQGLFGYSKKYLWLPKMHTVNKSEPKHVEA